MMTARGLPGHEQEFVDALHVMKVGMMHFFTKAMAARTNNGKPEVVDQNMLQAVSIAEKIAPYTYPRLSAVKLADNPQNRIDGDATQEELRAELRKHLAILAPVLDLEALMAPAGGVANRDVPQDKAGQ